MEIKRFYTSCSYPTNTHVPIETCWTCPHNDKKHSSNLDGCVHCTYGDEEDGN
jgi:hypothetical protein